MLRLCCSSLFDLNDSVIDNPDLKEIMTRSGAVKAVIASVKAQPKMEESVTAAVSFLDSYASVRFPVVALHHTLL